MDLSKWELHNLVRTPRGLKVRDALRTQVNSIDIRSPGAFVAGFTAEAANTTEVFHYLLIRDTSDAQGYLYVTTEEYVTVAVLNVGAIPPKPTVTAAVQYQQILINSPDFSAAYYGLVGGGLKRAVATASVNPNTEAITPPTGLCTTFGDRIAIAQYNQVYFNDAGTEIRTFTGANAISLPSTVYDLFTGPGGALYIVTGAGVYALPPDALGQGQIVYGMLARVSPYEASGYRNAVHARGGVYGLTRDGIGSLGNTVSTAALTQYDRRRYFSQSVGPGQSGDYRSGRIWALSDSMAISVNNSLCIYDLAGNYPYWVWNSSTGNALEIVGICKTRNGGDLFVTPTRILEFTGNYEFTADEQDGVACGTIATPPAASNVVRSVTTSSDNAGYNQLLYLNGSVKTQVTPAPSRAQNVVGTDLWDSSATLFASEMRSRRHHVAVRSDDLAMEVGATGCGRALGDIDITLAGKGRRRP